MATAFHLAWPYGVPRIMSSFHFSNRDMGPPADGSGNIIAPTFDAAGQCNNGWVCEHRYVLKHGYCVEILFSVLFLSLLVGLKSRG